MSGKKVHVNRKNSWIVLLLLAIVLAVIVPSVSFAGEQDPPAINRWDDLLSRVENAADGETIVLTQNLNDGGDDGCIVFDKKDKTVTLDLNGYKLDRNKNGSVIKVEDGTLIIIDGAGGTGKITGGDGDDDGGGIYIKKNGTLHFNGGTITGNKADNGGGIYNEGHLSIDGGTISDNIAEEDFGGGIYSTGDMVLKRGAIEKNTSSKDGGGLYITKGTAEISGGEIKNNIANKSGGGIRVDVDGTALITDGTISGNQASEDCGGGIFVNYSTLCLYGGEIRENQSGDVGSGIYVADDKSTSVKIHGAPVVKDNDSTHGCDIYLTSGKKLIVDGELSEQTELIVQIKGDLGTLTTDYSTYNTETDPTLFFTSDSNCGLSIQDGEVQIVSLWGGLATKIINTKEGETLKLDRDYTAVPEDDRLRITVDNDFTLDLNGHTLDRNLSKKSTTGHVIEIWGRLTIIDSSAKGTGKITGGNAESGGGIYINDGARLDLESGNITGNKADDGGGIYNKGELYVRGGSITKNKATKDWGGGIYSKNLMGFSGGTVSGNTSDKDGGGICCTEQTIITGGVIKDNTAKKSGGGIRLRDGKTEISGCTITGNTAKDGGGAGIYISSSETTELTIGSCEITGNTADDEGGGVYISDDSTQKIFIKDSPVIKDNSSDDGSNLYLESGMKLRLSGKLTEGAQIAVFCEKGHGTITSGYSDYNDEDPASFFIPRKGFTVYLNDDDEAAVKSEWPNLRKKLKDADDGETIKLEHDYTAEPDDDRLIVEEDHEVVLDLNGYTLDRNLTSSDDEGEVIRVYGELTIRDSSAKDGAEGTGVITGGYADEGGGINVDGDGYLIVEGGSIQDNRASDDGGGIYVDGEIKMTGGKVINNYGKEHGGGIYVDDPDKFSLSNAVISENSTHYDGGGIYIDDLDKDSEIENCEISNNKSTAEGSIGGGGIYYDASGQTLKLTDCHIDNNSTEEEGGGILLYDGTIKISGGSVSGNYARSYGGAVYVHDGDLTVNSGTIEGNSAVSGGGIYTYSEVTIKGGEIKNNTAGDHGGGLSTAKSGGDGEINLFGGTVTGNSAEGYGGGIYHDHNADELNVKGNPVVIGNSAPQGDDIYLCEDQKVDLDGSLEEGAMLGVARYDETGEVTTDYSDYHKKVDPNTFFAAKKGLTLKLSDGEVKIKSSWDDLQDIIDDADNESTITLDRDYAAVDDDDRLEIPKNKNITLDLNGYTLDRNRSSIDSSGHVFEVFGQLTLKDSSVKDGAEGTGTITGGAAGNGGGINVHNYATLIIESGTITGNKAERGGGIYAHGAVIMRGGTITANRADEDDAEGGGVYVNEGSLNITGGKITGNTAKKKGGGVYILDHKDAKFTISENPLVSNNSAKTGDDVYLDEDKVIELTGALGENAKIGVAVDDDYGTFTKGYSTFCDKSPSKYFISTEGYSIRRKGDEAVIAKKTDDWDTIEPFIGVKDQINADVESLNGKNWMSGISGERTLNEINIACTHDSSMNDVNWHRWASAGSFFGGHNNAKTQYRYIDEMLDEGVRFLDLRLNNRYETSSWWFDVEQKDDGRNLYLCHGKNKLAGTYWGADHDGSDLTFDTVIGWVKTFLQKHPSETIILDMSAETSRDGDIPKIFKRLHTKMVSLSEEINPTTGEPYLYMEDGVFGKEYTHYPKLKEIRGKIFLMCEDASSAGIGGLVDYTMGGCEVLSPVGDYTDEPEARIHHIETFVSQNKRPLLTNASEHSNILYKIGTNCAPVNSITTLPTATPIECVKKIHPALFGDDRLFGQMKGMYLGWVKQDGVTEEINRCIWSTNFFDGLEYCTITVDSGQEDKDRYPDQTYKLLKGTQIVFPSDIYRASSRANGFFDGWDAVSTEDGSEIGTFGPGEEYTLEKDVKFTARWSDKPGTIVRLVWKDGNDAENLRETKIELEVMPDEDDAQPYRVPIRMTDVWMTALTRYVKSVKPVWGRINESEEYPHGRDDAEEYRYEVDYDVKDGYTITLYHTPQATIPALGEVKWEDEGNKEKLRPDSVNIKLLADGYAVAAVTATAEDEWKWTYEDLPMFINGEKAEYTVKEEEPEGYYSEAEGFDITNFRTPDISKVEGRIAWDDSDNKAGKRPESVVVHLLANGEEVASRTVTAGTLHFWLWDFDDLPSKDENGEAIIYTITEDPVEDYTIKVDGYEDFHEDAEILTITNTYAPVLSLTTDHTDTSATITKPLSDDVTKYEYKLGDGAWQDAPEFTGLQPGTKYAVYARVKDMPDTEVSAEFVTDLTVALSKDTEVLTAGTTLTASVTGGTDAKCKYTWYRSDSEDFDDESTAEIGAADKASYTVSRKDIGKYIKVDVVQKKPESGGSAKTAKVDKATPTISPLPEPTEITYGQKLVESLLPGARISVMGEKISGLLLWAEGSTVPEVKDSNKTEYEIVFTPLESNKYNSATAKVKVTVNKADITPTVSLSGWIYGSNANKPNVEGNPGGGKETFLYKVKDADDSTYSEDVPTDAGQYTVKALIDETDNYNAGSAEVDFTISPADIQVTSGGYDGAYDGKSHTITVNAPAGSEVTYAEEGGSYTKDAPTYTSPGTYVVNYKVDLKNYNEFTGSETVHISQALITIQADNKNSTCDDPLEELTYSVIGGYVEGDDLGVSLTTNADIHKGGDYDIKVSWNENPNYSAELLNGVYSVTGVSAAEKAFAWRTLNTRLKGTSSGRKVTARWSKAFGADMYVVYAAYRDRKYKTIKTLGADKTRFVIKKLNGKKLKEKNTIKFYVEAYKEVDGQMMKLARSKTVFVAGSSNRIYTNANSIKLIKKTYTLEAGRSAKIKARLVLKNLFKMTLPGVPKFRYQSTDRSIATVTKSGRIKAVSKGNCTIYVFAPNGCTKIVTVIVK